MGDGEEVARQAVEVGDGGGGDAFGMGVAGPDQLAFGAPAYRAGPMGAGGGFVDAGENEVAGGSSDGFEESRFAFEGGNGGGVEVRLSGGDFGANDLQGALDGFDPGGFGGGGGEGCAQEAQRRGELVQGTERFDQDVGFGDADAVGEVGLAGVSG